jgi:hypothetical protein
MIQSIKVEEKCDNFLIVKFEQLREMYIFTYALVLLSVDSALIALQPTDFNEIRFQDHVVVICLCSCSF